MLQLLSHFDMSFHRITMQNHFYYTSYHIGSALLFTSPKPRDIQMLLSVSQLQQLQRIILFHSAGTSNIRMLLFLFFCFRLRNTKKGKWYHLIVFKEGCQHHVLQEWTRPASKDCYLCKDPMTRLLTSISFRSTLDTLAAVDFFNNLARQPFVCSC